MVRQQSLDGLPPGGLTDPEVENDRTKGRSLIIAGAMCVGLWLFFDSLAWLQNGGQVYSFIGAVNKVSNNFGSIEIDDDALFLPIMITLTLLTVGVWYFSKWEFKIDRRRNFLSFIGIVMGGTFFINFCFGGRALDDYMNSHAYLRCTARDHKVGHGKGSVWFIDYVRNPASCPGPTGYPNVERYGGDEWRLEQQLRAANKARNEGR
jgi:hypothetical protein